MGKEQVPVGAGGKVSEEKVIEETQVDDDSEYFGDMVPFGDPAHYQGWSSPYYNASHRKLRAYCRELFDEEVIPNVMEWDENKSVPKEVIAKMGQAGVLGGALGDKWWSDYSGGIKPPGGVKPEEWGAFHGLVLVDELSRCASGGALWGILGGLGIGLPPILHFGSEEMKQRVAPDCIAGNKRICLAITEPGGGSDVANLTTSAVKTEDGKHYIVNGEKKWITNSVTADYFTTAVRTGGKGMGGVSLLLIERKFEGVRTRQMDCSGAWASGTGYFTMEDVKVPVENIIGKENKGFQYIMANFNKERIGLAIQANRLARVCLEECIRYGSKRKTFGVLLRDHPVIREKLANMARQVESSHAWLETIVDQANHFDEDDLTLRGGGQAALLKAHCTKVLEYCSAEACQIFGGLSFTKGGQGEKIERIAREVRAYTIPGGSMEIMTDLGMRQAIKIAEIQGAKL